MLFRVPSEDAALVSFPNAGIFFTGTARLFSLFSIDSSKLISITTTSLHSLELNSHNMSLNSCRIRAISDLIITEKSWFSGCLLVNPFRI
jgi:hypothetical protein